jgi:hypothetical protein
MARCAESSSAHRVFCGRGRHGAVEPTTWESTKIKGGRCTSWKNKATGDRNSGAKVSPGNHNDAKVCMWLLPSCFQVSLCREMSTCFHFHYRVFAALHPRSIAQAWLTWALPSSGHRERWLGCGLSRDATMGGRFRSWAGPTRWGRIARALRIAVNR